MEEVKSGIATDLFHIIQSLLINTILFECCLAVLDHITHDALVHIALS